MTLEDLSTKPPPRVVDVKQEPTTTPPSPVRSAPVPNKAQSHSASQPVKPRLSLVERQSLINTSRSSDVALKKRRISNLHDSLPKPSKPFTNPDIFRFPSESPPKQPAKVPSNPISRPISDKDKENSEPSCPQSTTGRQRRRTFNITMEKLARMTQNEMQADVDWEANLAKRRRQSVAI
jgi:hypothetical protein